MHIAVRLKEYGPGEKDAAARPLVDAAAWQRTGLTEAVIEPVHAAAEEQLASTVEMLFPDRRMSA